MAPRGWRDQSEGIALRNLLPACVVLAVLVATDLAKGQDTAASPLSSTPFWHVWKQPDGPMTYTMSQLGRMIDDIEDDIRDDGIVVIKHPDVWGQARMTKYRVDFEKGMTDESTKFETVLSAAVARSDQASFEQQTAIGAALTPFGAAGGSRAGANPVQVLTTTPDQARADAATAADNAMKLLSESAKDGSLPDLEKSTAFNDLKLAITQNANSSGRPGIGLEPTVVLDEKKRYFDALNNIRRNNMGDDTADSAGYGLYLVRLPASVQPGEKTLRDHGAQVTVTVRHEFEPNFLTETYRNLVINDLVDQLGPLIFELIRTGLADQYGKLRDEWDRNGGFDEVNFLRIKYDELFAAMVRETAIYLPTSRVGERAYPIPPNDLPDVFDRTVLLYIALAARNVLMTNADKLKESERPEPRATDVMAYLRQELDAAYDLMVGRNGIPGPLADIAFIEEQVLHPVQEREFYATRSPATKLMTRADIWEQYHKHALALADRLPGDLRNRTLGGLAWAIAVDASLLNLRLREDIRRMQGRPGFACVPDIDSLYFYSPVPTPEAENAFREYVKARWPIVAFGLDPVTDQQNIADALNRYRDLQLALALSFSAGRINFNQLNRFRRQLAYEASTIALNRTVTAFALGDTTFGWRISPRYQTPPEEGSNLLVFANLLLRGGPGPNYQLRKSKLEAGQRELSAALIIPSFLSRARFEVSSNWYRLHDPDEITLGTNHILKQSRKVYELKQALACVCDADRYPPEALSRLVTKVEQLEAMLPTQTHIIDIPYENRLGGFELFTPGAASLVPQLLGYQGTAVVTTEGRNSILLLGKNISIQEYAVVAGGQEVPRADVEVLSREVVRIRLPKGLLITTAYNGKPFVEVHLATPNGISNRLLIPCRADVAPVVNQVTLTESRKTVDETSAPPGSGESGALPASPRMTTIAGDRRDLRTDAGIRPVRFQEPQTLPTLPSEAVKAAETRVASAFSRAPISQTVVVAPQPAPPAPPSPPKKKSGRKSLLDRLLHRD
jgi:hypothetical protein